jgi:hypothetical protein
MANSHQVVDALSNAVDTANCTVRAIQSWKSEIIMPGELSRSLDDTDVVRNRMVCPSDVYK